MKEDGNGKVSHPSRMRINNDRNSILAKEARAATFEEGAILLNKTQRAGRCHGASGIQMDSRSATEVARY